MFSEFGRFGNKKVTSIGHKLLFYGFIAWGVNLIVLFLPNYK